MFNLNIAKFREVLHEAIQSALRDGIDDIQANAAVQTQQGWMHIHGTILLPPSFHHSHNPFQTVLPVPYCT